MSQTFSAICSQGCVQSQGQCVQPDLCLCFDGWTGESCNLSTTSASTTTATTTTTTTATTTTTTTTTKATTHYVYKTTTPKPHGYYFQPIVTKPPQSQYKITTITSQSQSKIISVHMVQFDEFKLRDLIPFLSNEFPSLMKKMRQKKEDCTIK